MTRYIILGSLVLLVIIVACRPQSRSVPTPVDLHTSSNSLDWSGTYTGSLPCEGCEAIKALIRLNPDSTYEYEQLLVGHDESYFRSRGKFEWNNDGNSITLAGIDSKDIPVVYAVAENNLIQYELSGKPHSNNMAAMYTLTKSDSDLLEVHWKLIEVNGEAVPEELNSEPFLKLSSLSSIISGNGSCNDFFGTYEIQEGNKISFAGIGATKMACPVMEVEEAFFEALRQSDNYAVNGDELILYASQQVIARFKSVEKE